MSNRLEIILSEANEKAVSLSSMSSDALDSFMAVMQSLKSIAEANIIKEELLFSISEGSALCAVEAPAMYMDSMYNQMNLAIKGQSNDVDLTKHLRTIQKHLKDESFAYQFKYKGQSNIVDLHQKIINAKRISVKKNSNPYRYKLKVLTGYLNQIGGTNPNYHFDHGLKESVVIDCTREDAIEVKKYLYEDVETLLICKEYNSKNKKNEYYHKIILEKRLSYIFKSFIKSYYNCENLLDQLTFIYNLVDENFKSSKNGHEILKILLIAFNDKNLHLSELKTLLVISKPFKEHRDIKQVRLNLLETYQKKKN